MSWKNEVFQNFRLYAITDLKDEDASVLEKVEAACLGGADIVQLRSKTLSDGALLRLGKPMREICRRHQTLFFVNDRPDLALALEADGVHVGQDDMPVAVVRRLAANANQALLVGKSTHSLEQALEAGREGADYIGVGPVFTTPTKPGRAPVGLDLVRQVRAKVSLPFVAIGGIDAGNLAEVLAAGASRVAVVRAVFDAPDIYEKTKALSEQIRKEQVNNVEIG